jgi:hypothetical protein
MPAAFCFGPVKKMQQFRRFARLLTVVQPKKQQISAIPTENSHVCGVKADYFILVKKRA